MHKDYQDRGNRKRSNTSGSVVVLAVLTAILICGLYYDTFLGKAYVRTWMDTQMEARAKQTARKKKAAASKSVIPIQNENKASFQTNGKSFFQCTKDGMKYFGGYENQKWSDTFTMVNPVTIRDENCIAVGELIGRVAKVYQESGLMYTVQSDQPIVQMSLNKNGYLAAIINNKTDYRIEVYHSSGKIIFTRKEMEEGVYPIALDISDDNRVLAVSYLDTRDVEIISRVLFFYVNEAEGKEWEDSMFASIQKDGDIIPVISFMKEGRLAAVSDRSVFAADLQGKELWSMELTNKLDQVAFAGKNAIVIANGEILGGKEGKQEGLVEWIGLDGRVLGNYQAKDSVTYLKGTKEAMVVGSSRDFCAVGENGKPVWSHKATQDVDDILIMEKVNMVLYVTKNSAEIMDIGQLEEKKAEDLKEENEPGLEENQEEEEEIRNQNEDMNPIEEVPKEENSEPIS